MKYKPRNSNFDEMQCEAAMELVTALHGIERVKDTIARIIDEYVDAIMAELLEQRDFIALPNESGEVEIVFFSGDTTQPNGEEGFFEKKESLRDILDTLLTNCDYKYAEAAAVSLEATAARLRADSATQQETFERGIAYGVVAVSDEAGGGEVIVPTALANSEQR